MYIYLTNELILFNYIWFMVLFVYRYILTGCYL